MAMSVPAFQAECQDCTSYGFLRLISGIVILLITPGGTYFMEKRLEYLEKTWSTWIDRSTWVDRKDSSNMPRAEMHWDYIASRHRK